MQEFKLPDLGEGMQEAQIVEWLVKPGDTLKLDQPIVRVETDKAIVEIPSPVAGRVSEIRVPQGQVAKLGEVLVVFDSAPGANGGAATAQTAGRATATHGINGAITAPASAVQQGATQAQAATATKHRVLAAPAVRKLAFELGIDLEQVPSSHPSGRVTIEDVRTYAERAKTAPATPAPASLAEVAEQQRVESGVGTGVTETGEQKGHTVTTATTAQEEREPLTGLRKRIAERMERSWRTIPHATAFDEVDGAALAALRESLKPIAEQRGVRLTYMPLLVKLLIPVLKEFPIFNASLDEQRREIVYKRSYHIGVAADSPEGLLVPVLRDADHLTLMEIAARLEHLVEGARKRTLSLPELSGSTFTLNNVGSFGGSSGTPIINYPEAAILAVGRLQEKAIVRNGAIVARPMMPLALSFDHRLIDGALAGKFLARFKELVENPQQLMLDMV
jgi:pyruvate dehydrogenase E2 component (dihydrolipoamide acetyltransferase)